MTDTKIIAHRGANFFAPQNTIPAFEKAIQLKTDGFETDIHLTKDGIPVLCHNYTINATSNGKGNISDYTYEELLSYDFGGYFSPAYEGTKIPTVEEFLELFKAADLDVLNIEIKSPKDPKEYNIVEATIDLAKKHDLFDKLLISSFNPELLVRAKEYDSDCKTGILYSPDKKWAWPFILDPIKSALEIKADALHPHEMFVSREYVERAHANGLMVNPWTVNGAKNIEKLLDYGTDGIITNHVDLVNHIKAVRKEKYEK